MTNTLLGQQFDIHTGGVDLKLPHHDNEMVQSEAHYNSNTWINYFFPSDHLTISGYKISKSPKIFIIMK